jgi:hypothetical protein
MKKIPQNGSNPAIVEYMADGRLSCGFKVLTRAPWAGVVLAVQDLDYQQTFTNTKGLYSVVVITLGFDPSNPSSNPGTTFIFAAF